MYPIQDKNVQLIEGNIYIIHEVFSDRLKKYELTLLSK